MKKPASIIHISVRALQRSLHADASSIFLLDGLDLRGDPEAWDWTRTSFSVTLSDWPSVENALATNRAHYMTGGTSSGAEAGWFESRGIASSLCVPLRVGRVGVGVVFFDFDRIRMPRRDSVVLSERMANGWAQALSE